MAYVEKADSIQLHYLFGDRSHTIDANIRNECERELLQLFKVVADTLAMHFQVETLPTQEGGFREGWMWVGKHTNQITLVVSIIAMVMTRFPVENEELNNLQIENLKLDNELKRRELDNLKLDSINQQDEIEEQTIIDSLEIVKKNYKVSWHKSNFYRKLHSYAKVESIEVQRYREDIPVGQMRKLNKSNFPEFILKSDKLPDLALDNAVIDVISPAIKSGNFKWKGFYNKEIISFEMNHYAFKDRVLSGKVHFSNTFSIQVRMTQQRKIDQDGNVKVTNSIVHNVYATIEHEQRIEFIEG